MQEAVRFGIAARLVLFYVDDVKICCLCVGGGHTGQQMINHLLPGDQLEECNVTHFCLGLFPHTRK